MSREEQTARRQDGKTVGRGAACRVLDPETIDIQPAPSPAERDAILLAIQFVTKPEPREDPPEYAPWAAAGRQEALSGRLVKTRGGWGRSAGRMADW